MLKFETLFHKLPALILAYALALQPAFAAISHGQGVAEICTSRNGDSVPSSSGDHKGAECCLMFGCNGAVGVDSSPVAVIAPVLAVVPAPAIKTPHISLVDWPNERPNSARAPPA